MGTDVAGEPATAKLKPMVFSTLKTEAVVSSEKLKSIYQTTLHYMP
jgi:hypothetical protein